VVVKSRKITIELDEDTYKKLVEKAEKEGYSIVSDYIIYLIKKELGGGKTISLDEIMARIKPRIERIVQDETSRYLEMINELRMKIAEIHERIDGLSEEVEDLKKKIEEQAQKPYKPARRTSKTGIERLREDKVVFESNLPSRLRSDRFFNYLEREGAVVLRLTRERIAVDPEYWEEFKRRLFEELDSDDEEVIKRILGKPGYELFLKLREESLIYYDPKQRKWFPASKEYFR
jgi:FtsZ-binding cell division protein ZapB